MARGLQRWDYLAPRAALGKGAVDEENVDLCDRLGCQNRRRHGRGRERRAPRSRAATYLPASIGRAKAIEVIGTLPLHASGESHWD